MKLHYLFFIFLFFACNSSEKKTSTLSLTTNPDENLQLKTLQDNNLKESMARGEEIYNDFCINCHMARGEGVGRTYPPLANSDYLMENQEASIHGIKYGMQGRIVVNGQVYNNAMLPMGLEDEEIADVMNYINNSWGNKNETLITVEQVSNIEK